MLETNSLSETVANLLQFHHWNFSEIFDIRELSKSMEYIGAEGISNFVVKLSSQMQEAKAVCVAPKYLQKSF